ncbi:hypothetical protein QCD60_02485 [Pokkaliibacter sp. MBI-7]|uniref:hypothetical protein n=1 Tax=Pokkaliibacter sp. MBI-7 TaxID=3040600 RepID=UPI00244C68AC|nr:hypothetical protein [Pokkaliibacter sp. MBI-7]MDH2431425.1 hypothetical protein [Pokkaliibacter sp. MBI-7]
MQKLLTNLFQNYGFIDTTNSQHNSTIQLFSSIFNSSAHKNLEKLILDFATSTRNKQGITGRIKIDNSATQSKPSNKIKFYHSDISGTHTFIFELYLIKTKKEIHIRLPSKAGNNHISKPASTNHTTPDKNKEFYRIKVLDKMEDIQNILDAHNHIKILSR